MARQACRVLLFSTRIAVGLLEHIDPVLLDDFPPDRRIPAAPACLPRHDVSSHPIAVSGRRAAGQQADCANWISDALERERDRQLLADRNRLADPLSAGSQGATGKVQFARQTDCTASTSKLLQATGEPVGSDEKGVLVGRPPLPGCLSTVAKGDDARFVKTYFSSSIMECSSDWARGSRPSSSWPRRRRSTSPGTAGAARIEKRAIEQSVVVAEQTVVADRLKEQVAAFVVLKIIRLASSASQQAAQQALIATVVSS